ncbi:MAG: replicative DNA helicase [Symbiobacteriaceae bacterium]|nr:replicative DNA helicase [Symbiobacteriaceae bacterium]
MSERERIPPNNREAEQSVLGAIMLDRQAVISVMEELREEDFFHGQHRQIFGAAHAVYNRGEAVDLVTLSTELRRRQQLEEVGSWTYLNELGLAVPTTAHLGLYIRAVRDASTQRQLITACSKIANLCFTASDSVEDIIDVAERDIMEIATRGNREKPYASLGEVLVEGYENLAYLMENKGALTGVATGFKDLDGFTSGLQPSDFIVLAARPGVGKSALMLNIALHAAATQEIPVAFFSLEMSRLQVAQRLLATSSKVNLQNLINGKMQDQDWATISQTIGTLAAAPIYIDDSGALSIADLRSRVRRLKMEHNVGLVIVDYLQLMTLGSRIENRQQEISFISRALKALAKEVNVPVMAASQLSRAVEQRADKRPILSDLLESGGIEANADLVMFLYRDDYYHKEASPSPNTAELILAKQRNGPTGTVRLYYVAPINLFVDMVKG